MGKYLRFGGLFIVLAALLFSACGTASRAVVHPDDYKKVFPWPRKQRTVAIKAMPKTVLANSCPLFGSYKSVEVDGDTTFFVTDELGKKFAYTPSRSPMRRLAPVDTIEIRWGDLSGAAASEEESEQEDDKDSESRAEEDDEDEKPAAKKVEDEQEEEEEE